MTKKTIKVIIDTNVWISYLIGKQLAELNGCIIAGSVQIVLSKQLIEELKRVTKREKIRKYFPESAVAELLELLEAISLVYDTNPVHALHRDPKDSFLLDLIDLSKADYLVTGDKDLLELNHSN